MNRFRMIPMLAAAGCAMVAVAPAVAIAGAETSLTNTVPGWYYRMPQNATNIDMLMTVDALDENVLYTGGIYMDGSSLDTVFNMHGVAYWSQDAGARVNDIAGVLRGNLTNMCSMVDIDAVTPGIGSNARTVLPVNSVLWSVNVCGVPPFGRFV